MAGGCRLTGLIAWLGTPHKAASCAVFSASAAQQPHATSPRWRGMWDRRAAPLPAPDQALDSTHRHVRQRISCCEHWPIRCGAPAWLTVRRDVDACDAWEGLANVHLLVDELGGSPRCCRAHGWSESTIAGACVSGPRPNATARTQHGGCPTPALVRAAAQHVQPRSAECGDRVIGVPPNARDRSL